MSDRAARWVQWSDGAGLVTITAGTVSRLFIMSISEAIIERKMESYTILRSLMRGYIKTATGASAVTVGMIALPQPVTLASLGPADDPQVDWLYHEEFMREGDPVNDIVRDLGGKRKVKGSDSELYLYIRNRGPNTTVAHFSGRTLVLLP